MKFILNIFSNQDVMAEKQPSNHEEYLYMVRYFPYRHISHSESYRDRDGVHFDLATAEEKVKELIDRRVGYTVYYWEQNDLKSSFLFSRAKHDRLDGRYGIREIITSKSNTYSLKNGDCYWPKKEAAETARVLNRQDANNVYWIERTQYQIENP